MTEKVIENEIKEASPINTNEEISNEEIKPNSLFIVEPHDHDGQNSDKINVDNLEANLVSVNEFVANTANIKDAIITNAKIDSLAVSKLTAGTITSKTITLAIDPGKGDVYIAAGKTDFNNNANGFILGLDDSDSDLAKFYIGSTTVYWNFTGTAINIVGADLVAGSIKTSTNTADARIYITSNVLRSYVGSKGDEAWGLEINANELLFYDYNTTNKKTASIYSSVDKISLRVYDINEAASETYLFGASSFYPSNTGTAPTLGTSSKKWATAYIDTLDVDVVGLNSEVHNSPADGDMWYDGTDPRFYDGTTSFKIPVTSGTTGGSGSAGSGNQYLEIRVAGNTFKVLHDGTV